MIDLTKTKDAERAFKTAVSTEPKGTWIAYFEGCYSSQVCRTKQGRAAWDAHEAGQVVLCQKKLGDEHYLYCAVVS